MDGGSYHPEIESFDDYGSRIHDVDNVNVKHFEIVYWPVGIERIIFWKDGCSVGNMKLRKSSMAAGQSRPHNAPDETGEKHALGFLEYRVPSSCLSYLSSTQAKSILTSLENNCQIL
jgi:hypothetical protein